MRQATIKVKRFEISQNIIEAELDISAELNPYFRSTIFRSEYSESIDSVPESIAIIPLLCNILPISWITDSEIIIDCLDSHFYNSVESFKEGYRKMWNEVDFKGKLSVKRLTNHTIDQKTLRPGALFSGGLDAFATLIAHASENPHLITVQGADIETANSQGWLEVIKQNEITVKQFNTTITYVKSNFREFLNEKYLNSLVVATGDGWWHGFQHGIGLLGLCAPVAHTRKLNRMYIASSYTAKENARCASTPSIDENVRYCGVHVIHDQFEFSRLEKTIHVCEYVKRNNLKIYLRVCWRESSGKNCCSCEKCLRTSVAIAVLGYDLDRFGFTKNNLFRLSRWKVAYQVDSSMISLWNEMRNYIMEHSQIRVPKGLKWLVASNLELDRNSIYARAMRRIERKTGLISRFFRIV